jgi:hypothetical protein
VGGRLRVGVELAVWFRNRWPIYMAASYKVAEWEAYTVNGDASNWLDARRIPAVSILILDYTEVDWTNNLRAIRTLIRNYSQ